MTDRTTLAIVGGGLAGAKAAEAARGAGYDGRIVLVSEEAHPPYERPPLSKSVLRGEDRPDSTAVHPGGYYAEHAIEFVNRAATGLDPTSRTITFDSGDSIQFTTAVIATGAVPRRLDVPGSDLEGVHYLRTIDDALALADTIRGANRIAVIGAGWIGTEVAASARLMGTDVILIDPAPVPLHRVLGEDLGAMFAKLHADHGVALRLGTGVEALTGTDHVEAVALADSTTHDVDAAIIGIGVLPRTDIVDPAGPIELDNGIKVDERLQTTVDGIYAAGDVANAFHPHYQTHIRVEHWANALNQGTLAGANATGQARSYDRLPYFYSDQYDVGLEYVGRARPGDTLSIRGDIDSGKFIAAWHNNGTISAAMNVNIWDVVDDLKALISSGRPVDIAKFTNPDVPLAELVP